MGSPLMGLLSGRRNTGRHPTGTTIRSLGQKSQAGMLEEMSGGNSGRSVCGRFVIYIYGLLINYGTTILVFQCNTCITPGNKIEIFYLCCIL